MRSCNGADRRNLTLIYFSHPGTGPNNEEHPGYFEDRKSIIRIDAAKHIAWEKR